MDNSDILTVVSIEDLEEQAVDDSSIVYSDWLASLKLGSLVKIGDCSSRSCSCQYYTIKSLVTVFNSTPAFVVGENCTVRYFETLTGKEIGSRKNTYKGGYITFITKKELEDLKILKIKKELAKQKEQNVEKLLKLIATSETQNYYRSAFHLNYIANETVLHLIDLLEKNPLPKLNSVN